MKNKNKSKKGLLAKIASHNICFVGIIVALVSVIGVILLDSAENRANKVLNVIINIFYSGIPLGVISIIYGYFDSLNYATKKITEALFENEGFLNLSDDIKNNIKNSIEKDLLLDELDTKDSLLCVVQNEIAPLIKKYYYKEQVVDIDCLIENDLIIKNIEERYVIEKPKLKRVCENIPLKLEDIFGVRSFGQDKTECSDNKCMECKEKCLELKQVIINGNLLKENEDYQQCLPESLVRIGYEQIPKYDKTFSYRFMKGYNLENEPLTLKLIYTTRVSINDTVYVQKLRKPVKDFTLHFNYDNSKMDVTSAGFGFMDNMSNAKDRIINGFYKNGIKIRLANWALPGNGIFIAMELKNNKIIS